MAAGAGWAVLVAGGLGARLGGPTPKQFLTVAGRPLLWWTFRALDEAAELAGVTVVAPAAWLDRARSVVCGTDRRAAELCVAAGGATRQDSVRAGLATIPAGVPWVLVHDAARPFVSRELVARLVGGLARARAVVPGVPERHTLKAVSADGFVLRTVDRVGLVEIQTPQAFDLGVLRQAHDRALRERLVASDDAALAESLGEPVLVVEGEEPNLKVTTARDIVLLECILARRASGGPPVW